MHYTTETEVKDYLERRLLEMTDKIYNVQVEKIEQRHYLFSAFHISSYCTNSEVFMDRLLWPEECDNVRWYTKSRRHNYTPRGYTNAPY